MSWQYTSKNMVYDIKGKTCLVTGGASGVGALCVEAFLKAGAKFVAILDVDEVKSQALETKLTKEYPGRIVFVKCDYNDEDKIIAAFNAVVGQVKQLDVLVNNALNDAEAFLRTSSYVDTLMGAISLNLKSMQHMRKDRGGAGGTIINVAYRAALGLTASKDSKPNCRAADATIIHFSRSISEKSFNYKTGVRVLMINFGLTSSPILQSMLVPVTPSMARSLKENNVGTTHCQRPESAAAAYVAVFKNGANGSVWMSQKDDPAEDITATIVQG